MSEQHTNTAASQRGRVWLEALVAGGSPVAGLPDSVQAADIELAGRAARVIAVLPDPANQVSARQKRRSGAAGRLERRPGRQRGGQGRCRGQGR